MPWQGYNFEDSILVSERIAKDDVFTSIHIEEFECVARDTKLGKEEVTRDIPNVGEEARKDLDESGIVRIGAEVKPGDILVGKITPKGETQLSPEEKLLRAIFGEKAGDVRDSSLRVPPGVSGIVINARIFARKGTETDERAVSIEGAEKDRLERQRDEEVKILRDSFFRGLKKKLVGQTTTGKLVDDKGKVLLQKGQAIDEAAMDEIPHKYWGELPVDDVEDISSKLNELEEIIRVREEHFRDKIDRLSKGDELPPGVIKMVKVYIAIKR
jgi:DNA-directed RNA polymerase subunit beta